MAKKLSRFFSTHKTLIFSIGFLVFYTVTISYATPPSSPYSAGATLNPTCAPGSTNCTVAVATTYTFGTGLTNTGGSITDNLATGMAGGQSVIGGTGAGDNLTLVSTSNTTKGKIIFGAAGISAYDATTNRLGIGTAAPTALLTLQAAAANAPSILINDGGGLELARIVSDNNTNFYAGYKTGLNSIATSTTSGEQNTFVGSQAGGLNTSGYNDTFIGFQSGYQTTIGPGPYSGQYAGENNVAVGTQALYSNVYGYGNTALGYQALYNNTGPFQDTAIGYQAMGNSTPGAGYNNTAIGYQALYNTAGEKNVAIGTSALYNNTTGIRNVAIGGESTLGGNTTGSVNTAVGNQSMASNTTGSGNVSLGNGALNTNSIGSNNIGIGQGAGGVSTGSENIFLGHQSGPSNTTGSYNIGVGYQAGGVTAGSYNLGVGYQAGGATTGSYNLGFGYQSGTSNTTGSYNIVLGSYINNPSATASGQLNIGNVLYGTNLYQGVSLSSSPVNNGYLGIGTSSPTSKLDITQLGIGGTQTTAVDGLSINNTTAAVNGTQQVSPAFRLTSQGFGTTAATSQPVSFHAFVTPVQGLIPTGYLGFGSSVNNGAYSDGQMVLTTGGFVGIGTTGPGFLLQVGNNSVSGIVARFQNSTGTCDINPTTTALSCSSDMTLKKNISNLSDNSAWSFNTNITPSNQSILAEVLALNPVDYNWNIEQNTDPKHIGFIAQEVQQVFPSLVASDPTSHLLSLNYIGLIPYTIEAIKEMNVNIISIDDLTKTNSWRDAIIVWLGDAKNGITSLVVQKQICVDNQCLTKDDIHQLLQMEKNSSGGNTTSTTVVQPTSLPDTSSTPSTIQSPDVTQPPVSADSGQTQSPQS